MIFLNTNAILWLFSFKVFADAAPLPGNTLSLIPYAQNTPLPRTWWNSVHHGSLSSDTTSVRKPSLISSGWAELDACLISSHSILFVLWLQLLALYFIRETAYSLVCFPGETVSSMPGVYVWFTVVSPRPSTTPGIFMEWTNQQINEKMGLSGIM